MYYLKTYKNGTHFMVAACDEEVLGKTLEYRKKTVEISRSFYGGEKVSEAELEKALAKATTANLFGKKTVQCAIKCGFTDEDSVLIIDGVPHVQIFYV